MLKLSSIQIALNYWYWKEQLKPSKKSLFFKAHAQIENDAPMKFPFTPLDKGLNPGFARLDPGAGWPALAPIFWDSGKLTSKSAACATNIVKV